MAEEKRRGRAGLECFRRNAPLLGGIFKFDNASAKQAAAVREQRLAKPAVFVDEMADTLYAADAGFVLGTMSAALGSHIRKSACRVLMPCLGIQSSFGFDRNGVPSGCSHFRFDTFMGSTPWRRQGTRPWDGTPLRALNLSHLGDIYGSFILCVEAEDDETTASISMFEFLGLPKYAGWQRPARRAPCPARGLACLGPPSVCTGRIDKWFSTCEYVFDMKPVLPQAFSTPLLRRQGWRFKLYKAGEQQLPFDDEPLQELSYCNA
jgi:hypothetical protein